MDKCQYIINVVRKDIVTNNLHVKAIIQDINNCEGPLSTLEELNTAGRAKISALRKNIEQLNELVCESNDDELLNEVDSHRRQLTSTLAAFRKANITAMLAIEKSNKNELLETEKSEESNLRQRQTSKSSLLKTSSNITEHLLSISRQLADTTQRSADTLDTLSQSSSTVQGTNDELLTTSSTIGQSGKLLAKYGRREFTDKILLFFAFSFFLACVFYIVQKRLL